jgi:hypothetical protein
MINEIDLDIVISELRVELDRIDRAILVFERLALEKKPARRAISRTGSVRFKRSGASHSAQSPANSA